MKVKNNDLIKSIVMLVVLAGVLLLLRKFVLGPVIVSGTSMDPTLQDGERVIALYNTKIERYDIVTFPAPDEKGKSYIKRVIGMPGDTVEYKDDTLYLNGKKVAEKYLDEFKEKLDDGQPLTPNFTLADLQAQLKATGVELPLTTDGKIPKGKLFVLGDNRRVSKDSRYIGYINETDVSGDVKFCFWPPSKFGTVK